jgi:hypothetical protein
MPEYDDVMSGGGPPSVGLRRVCPTRAGAHPGPAPAWGMPAMKPNREWTNARRRSPSATQRDPGLPPRRDCA